MERKIFIIEGRTVSISFLGNGSANENCGEVWMTAWEMADLFGVTVGKVNAAVKAVRKSDILNDHEVCRYTRLENGFHADVYSPEIIIAVAFRLNTCHAHLFRRWLVGRVTAKERSSAYVLFMRGGQGAHS